jgi:hypothetical protein
MRTRLIWTAAAALVVGVIFGLYWFQPWKLVTDQRVDEALSSPAAAAQPTAQATASTQPQTPAGPAIIAQGTFVSHEHKTSGMVRVIQSADGSRRLEFVGLDTSNGPDLRVWLTDQAVVPGSAGWHVFDDGTYLELGRLKGNRGNQAYDIPATADLNKLHSVSIWCKRFSVSFGAAELAPA